VPSAVTNSTLPVRAALLATGNFLSMVPRIVMQFPPKKRLLSVLPVDLPQTAKPLVLMTLKNRTLNPAAELFIDQLRNIAKRAAGQVAA
jgi:DNA-binding transcriptional LysR family regulator